MNKFVSNMKMMTNLILESVSAALHVHFLCIGIIELALAQLAIEAHSLSLLVLHLFNVFLTCQQRGIGAQINLMPTPLCCGSIFFIASFFFFFFFCQKGSVTWSSPTGWTSFSPGSNTVSSSSSGGSTTAVVFAALAAATAAVAPTAAGFAVFTSSVFPDVVFNWVPPTKLLATVAAQDKEGKCK